MLACLATMVREKTLLDRIQALVLGTALLGLVAVAGWWTLFLRGRFAQHEQALAERDLRIASLEVDVQQRDERIRALEHALHLLKVDHRVARLEVIEQTSWAHSGSAPASATGATSATQSASAPASAPAAANVRTRVRFTELGDEGERIGEPRELVVEGRFAYVEALVVKFEDDYVERGDALRGSSICLFQRIFGEGQKPSEGARLDPVGLRPRAYGGDELVDPQFEDLWRRFWDYANEPELARAKGVRAVHGEAPFIELRPGKSYRLELRASGGLSIRPE
jgi:hypothetical protein